MTFLALNNPVKLRCIKSLKQVNSPRLILDKLLLDVLVHHGSTNSLNKIHLYRK